MLVMVSHSDYILYMQLCIFSMSMTISHVACQFLFQLGLRLSFEEPMPSATILNSKNACDVLRITREKVEVIKNKTTHM